MNVRHDRSYISENSRDLIGRGYAAEVLDTLRFRFTYTQVERDANRSRAQTQPYADGIAERAKAAMLRSAEMEQIMATIAEQFVCYQYDDRKYPFRDGGWDLFFWCNCFFNTMPGHGLDGRDYSYFTLSFNEQHTAEKRKEICDSVLALINEKFPANPHLDIALQYSALLDYTRIKAETAAVTPKLIGKTCSFRGKDGRIQQVEDKIFFFPKSVFVVSPVIFSTTKSLWMPSGCTRPEKRSFTIASVSSPSFPLRESTRRPWPKSVLISLKSPDRTVSP